MPIPRLPSSFGPLFRKKVCRFVFVLDLIDVCVFVACWSTLLSLDIHTSTTTFSLSKQTQAFTCMPSAEMESSRAASAASEARWILAPAATHRPASSQVLMCNAALQRARVMWRSSAPEQERLVRLTMCWPMALPVAMGRAVLLAVAAVVFACVDRVSLAVTVLAVPISSAAAAAMQTVRS